MFPHVTTPSSPQYLEAPQQQSKGKQAGHARTSSDDDPLSGMELSPEDRSRIAGGGDIPLIHREGSRRPRSLGRYTVGKQALDFIRNGPFFVGVFDSSNGGIVAANNIEKMLGDKPHRLILFLDHGNAPYGNLSRAELIKWVDQALTLAQNVVDVLVMACNTACTAFKQDPEDHEGIDLSKYKIKVIDLISNTAEMIAHEGGDYPIVLSTEATANDDMYENEILAAARKLGKGKPGNPPLPKITRIAGGNKAEHPSEDLATLVNELRHLGQRSDRQKVKFMIGKFLSPKIDSRHTKMYLSCTHYPALKNTIEDWLADNGFEHIEVVDPMRVQGEALHKNLDENESLDRLNRVRGRDPIVITTGHADTVEHSVSKLYRSGATVVATEAFAAFDPEELKKDVLIKDPYSTSVFSAGSELGTRRSGEEIRGRQSMDEPMDLDDSMDASLATLRPSQGEASNDPGEASSGGRMTRSMTWRREGNG